jgi:hypothetical protein
MRHRSPGSGTFRLEDLCFVGAGAPARVLRIRP